MNLHFDQPPHCRSPSFSLSLSLSLSLSPSLSTLQTLFLGALEPFSIVCIMLKIDLRRSHKVGEGEEEWSVACILYLRDKEWKYLYRVHENRRHRTVLLPTCTFQYIHMYICIVAIPTLAIISLALASKNIQQNATTHDVTLSVGLAQPLHLVMLH